MSDQQSKNGFDWQVNVWDKQADIYQKDIVSKFVPVIDQMVKFAELQADEIVLDLGTGTGSLAFAASKKVGKFGKITAVDISSNMLVKAKKGAESLGIKNIEFVHGRGEEIPAPDSSQDAVLASLSIMYIVDRAKAAQEISRILKPGGRFVASVWAGPEQADIVLFQQIAGSFAPAPPVKGVGPGSLADPTPFLNQLSEFGLKAKVETKTTKFVFPNFSSAWNALAGVTTSELDEEIRIEAMSAVQERMWSDQESPREFCNKTHFIIAKKKN